MYPANGHVEPGGATISRTVTLPDGQVVEVRKLSVGSMDNNCYVLVNGGQALLIDAADDADRILSEVEDVVVCTILTTHGHRDHWQALAEVAEATGADVVHHAEDTPMIPVPASRHVGDGDTIAVGDAEVTLIHNPGHTPGSTSVLLGNQVLFSGDTLFPGGPGNTFGDAAAFGRIMDSLEAKLFGALGDDVAVLPGHGDDTTIGTERPHLAGWRERGW